MWKVILDKVGHTSGSFGFCCCVPFTAAPPFRPRLMASRREERDYGAFPSEQRSEPCVTVADSPTQPTGFNHVCSPSMFSLFLFRFISLRLGFSLPSSSLSAQVYWKHFSSCLWQARQMKNKFQIWSVRPFNLWLCFLLVNTVAPPCAYVCVWCQCGLRFSQIFVLENVPGCVF